MGSMFPLSGVPPADAINSIPDPNTVNCQELWYSTSRCAPRFDPAAANAMLAELVNLINKGEVQYDCNRNDQIEHAVRYLIQRSLPIGATLAAGPFDYIANLDPTLTRYNDYLTLIVVPGVGNQGAMTLNVDSHGALPVLRNDKQPVQNGDFIAGVPAIITQFQGAWYLDGLAASQVPILSSGVDLWIRTDGNDTTGDGSANSPSKAFRTINGAWQRAGNRYAATPLFTMNFRLGIPGVYEGGFLGPFGGNVSLSGDINNPGGYQIAGKQAATLWIALQAANINQFTLNGVTLMRDSATVQNYALRTVASSVVLNNVWFESTAANPNSSFITMLGGSMLTGSDIIFQGRNLAIGTVIVVTNAANFGGGSAIPPALNYRINDCPIQNAGFLAQGLGSIRFSNSTSVVINTNTTGRKYSVAENAVINMGGWQPPGDQPGSVSSGGQYIP